MTSCLRVVLLLQHVQHAMLLFKRKYSCQYATILKLMFQQSYKSDQTEFNMLLLNPTLRVPAKLSLILIQSMEKTKTQCVNVQLQVRGKLLKAATHILYIKISKCCSHPYQSGEQNTHFGICLSPHLLASF